MPRLGLLLINVGTPADPSPEAVKKYLAEFLMDPYVVDIPAPLRWLLVHGLILRTRPVASAKLYAKIWSERGSPLAFHLSDLVVKLRSELGPSWAVEGGMRYRDPRLRDALLKLKEAAVDRIVAVPLYPQYSLAATKTSEEETRRWVNAILPGRRLDFVPPFYAEIDFLRAFTNVARRSLQDFAYDHILFSFHGLPERQVKKTDRSGTHCLASGSCCDAIVDANRDCYRAQCFYTAREIASRLGVPRNTYTVCFQSRLGRTPWIQPFTDELYRVLPERGYKRVAVIAPSFVADCLETLEEVAIRGLELFKRSGGEELRLVPSLNSDPEWVNAVAVMARTAVDRAGLQAAGIQI